MGRASKNSWATMKGVLLPSASGGALEGEGRLQEGPILEGTKLIFSVQNTGRFAYLLILLYPIGSSVNGQSPQRSLCCASLNAGLASTK